jgi:transposase
VFDGCIGALVDDTPDSGKFMEPLLAARQRLRATFMALHHKLLSIQ